MIVESLLVIGTALLLDLKFGDLKNKYHPTAWIGYFLAKLTLVAKNENPALEKFGGICIILITSFIVILLLFTLDIGISLITVDYTSLIISVIIGALLLKSTIAIHGIQKHA